MSPTAPPAPLSAPLAAAPRAGGIAGTGLGRLQLKPGRAGIQVSSHSHQAASPGPGDEGSDQPRPAGGGSGAKPGRGGGQGWVLGAGLPHRQVTPAAGPRRQAGETSPPAAPALCQPYSLQNKQSSGLCLPM